MNCTHISVSTGHLTGNFTPTLQGSSAQQKDGDVANVRDSNSNSSLQSDSTRMASSSLVCPPGLTSLPTPSVGALPPPPELFWKRSRHESGKELADRLADIQT